jgi:hypothetical protein
MTKLYRQRPLRGLVLVSSAAMLSACGVQKEHSTMIAAEYPSDSFASCRDVPELHRKSIFGDFAVVRCIDKKPSARMLHDLSLDTDIVRQEAAAICFTIEEKQDLVIVHGYGYPDDASLSKKRPCQSVHD